MSTTVYKVVSVIAGRYFSAVTTNHKFLLEYRLNKKTEAPAFYPEAWPIAFSRLEQAIDFINSVDRTQLRIFKAEASATRLCTSLSYYIENFWKHESRSMFTPPVGTLFCKDITLIEELHP